MNDPLICDKLLWKGWFGYPIDFQWFIDSLWPHDDILRHRSESTPVKVMACYLMAQNHHLNQCCLINKVQWHSSAGNFSKSVNGITGLSHHWLHVMSRQLLLHVVCIYYIMTWLLGIKLLPEQRWLIINWTLKHKCQLENWIKENMLALLCLGINALTMM